MSRRRHPTSVTSIASVATVELDPAFCVHDMPSTKVNGVEINFRLEGRAEGPTVVLSNSLVSNLTMWDPQARAMVAAGYRVLRYDTRGQGRSEVTVGPYTMEMLADDAVGLMNALDIERASFCGLSKGGMTGLMLATLFSKRLECLIVASTAAHMPPRKMWDDRMKLVRQDGMGAIAELAVERWFTAAGRRANGNVVDAIRQGVLETPIEGYCACAEAIRDMDQRETIGAITTPTLIAVGEYDKGTPVEAARLLHGRIHGSELIIFPGCAHLVNLEQAEAFNQVLLAFLDKHIEP